MSGHHDEIDIQIVDGTVDVDFWLRYWWLFPFFLLGATTVDTIGISGSALFVPFFMFIRTQGGYLGTASSTGDSG